MFKKQELNHSFSGFLIIFIEETLSDLFRSQTEVKRLKAG